MSIADGAPVSSESNRVVFSLREIAEYRCPFPFRVLVVENDPEFRGLLSSNLTLWGFKAVVANGVGMDLLDTAEKEAALQRCHLALVDMRLINDDDGGDYSGLELVPRLQPTGCIIVSGSPRLTRSIERAVRDIPGILDCVTKGEMSAVCRSLIKITEQRWNLHMQYEWPERYSQTDILGRIRSFNPKSVTQWDQLLDGLSDEVDVALRGLYRPDQRPNIASLHLKPIERTNALTSDSLYGRRSVVLYAEPREMNGQHCIREVIKFAPRMHIEDELDNYRDYVNGKLDPAYRASIDGSSILRDIGALRYTQVEGESFVEWYSQTDNIDRVCQVIHHLFYSTLKPWWDLNPHHEFEHKNTYEHYMQVFPNLNRWIEVYRQRSENQERQVRIGSMRVAFPDPVLYAYERRKKPVFKSWWCTTVHGDLHAGNVFIKHDATTCVLDFERSHPGYFLQDFVELEKSIRLQLLDLSEDQLGYALYLDSLLMSQQRLDRLPNWAVPPGYTENDPVMRKLHKAFDAIRTVRAAAADIGAGTGPDQMEEYYWALLMETLFSVTRPGIENVGPPSFTQQRAFLAAAVICERLERWKNPKKLWPPEEWQPYLMEPDSVTAGTYHAAISEAPWIRLGLTDMRNERHEFEVRVEEIPNKQPKAISKLPYDGNELVAVMKLLELGRYEVNDFYPKQIAALQKLELLRDDMVVEDWIERVGGHMYETLVPPEGGVRTEFENTLRTKREGGSLQLIFDKGATALACYPWELLHDGYPTDSRTEIDVVRYIASDRPAQELEVPDYERPCRVLYVSARPKGLAQVELDRDAVKNCVASQSSAGRFEFEELKQHTHEAFKERLIDSSLRPIHVLHFDGHGVFARCCPYCHTSCHPHLLVCDSCGRTLAGASPRGYLAFETPTGEADLIDTKKTLEGLPRSQIRLAVLSSCQSARVRGADLLLAGVGPGLILGGVPAVVAMQFSILASDAIRFNKEFYKALVQGVPLPGAVNRGRTMLSEPARWSPVLYLRSQDHQTRLCAQA